MEWLNYHHLRYFWKVAKEGSLKKAAQSLHVSQPSISAQLAELEHALGEKLFRRSGRTKVLTDTGQLAFQYAEEIFSLGRELTDVVKQRPTSRALRLQVGVADSFPKPVTSEILKPVFNMPQAVQVVCREGKIEDLLAQLSVHRFDIVLADEAASTSTQFKTFNHPLGDTGTIFCAERRLATKLRRGFPASLNGAPALLPAENTALRRSLETWFRDRNIQPRVVAEFEDLALMEVMALGGRGFVPVPSMVAKDILSRYNFQQIGEAPQCRVQLVGITTERRIIHPAVALITNVSRTST